MNHKIYPVYHFELELTDDEFQILFEAAGRHYDYTVKGLVHQGGILYGHKNSRDFWKTGKSSLDTMPTLSVTQRELQLLIKSIEFFSMAGARELGDALRKAVRALRKIAGE